MGLGTPCVASTRTLKYPPVLPAECHVLPVATGRAVLLKKVDVRMARLPPYCSRMTILATIVVVLDVPKMRQVEASSCLRTVARTVRQTSY